MSAVLTTPPHRLCPGFLGDDLAAAILAHAISNQARMKPTTVGFGDRNRRDESIRSSTVLRDLGACLDPVMERVDACEPELLQALGMKPFTRSHVQVELVAHGDGAFYTRHIDTMTGPVQQQGPRRLTMVWYAHHRPKAFSGGALRLHALMGDQFTDIEPAHDLMVAFPSWMPHEVMPVSVPGGRFADSRFAMNIWLCGT